LESWGIAFILGIVEGITEFIPVSSTGHLIVVGHLLGFVGEKAATFEIVIQLGAILAVVVLYWRRFLRLVPCGIEATRRTGSNLEGWAGVWRITAATLPALIVGYFARDLIREYLFSPITVSWALAAGGAGILIVEKTVAGRSRCSLDALTFKQALGIGLFQVLSLWPGVSRAAATIVGGLLLGLGRKEAAEFSFLIAVPIMLAASAYEILIMGSVFNSQEIVFFLVGFGMSFIVALMAVTTFLRILGRWSLAPFAWYRIAAAPVFYILARGLNL
jgi:undecaprenyl-diphosphatase